MFVVVVVVDEIEDENIEEGITVQVLITTNIYELY